LSGVCSTFYVDSDGDGYGTSASVQRCGTTVPSGYADKSGDCCDVDATAYPGSTTTLSTADACRSFDYNCDGHETPKSNGPSDCGTATCDANCNYAGGCTCAGENPCASFSTADCGQPYWVSTQHCKLTGSCSVGGDGYVGGTQACN
jgi:hypothetical protein